MILVLPHELKNEPYFSESKNIPTHIQKKIEDAMYILRSDVEFKKFIDSHNLRYENISLYILNSNKDLEMIRKSKDEVVTVIFDSAITQLLQVSFKQEFLKKSVNKDFEIIEMLNQTLQKFVNIDMSELIRHYSQQDELYLIDLSYVHNKIKDKACNEIGRWIKSQTKANVGVALKDEFGELQMHYDTAKIVFEKKLVEQHKPYEVKSSQGVHYLPIATEEKLFGVCLIANVDYIEERKLALFQLGVNLLALVIKDMY